MPTGLLIPNAAQRRLESVCGERVPGPNSRVDFRSLSACSSGRPPSVCGGGSLAGLRSCAVEPREKAIAASSSPKKMTLCVSCDTPLFQADAIMG